MPTKARYHQLQNDIYYHIFNRGNRKLEIFHEDGDYMYFKVLLKKYVVRDGLIIYHYCLMPNHYHLETEIKVPEHLSSVIAGLNKAYSDYYHKKYNTSGYLWQGRFKSKPVEKEVYSLWCGSYIEMNPVRANMVNSPLEYKYSSARYYVFGEKDDIVTQDPNFTGFGNNDEERRENYLKFLVGLDQDKIKKEVSREIIGSRKFKNRLRKKNGRWIPMRNGRPRINV